MSSRIRAKKSLGQHFLADQNIARKIVGALDPQVKGPVVEVGPGMGALTRFLVERDKIDLYLIEIDSKSVEYLNENFPGIRDKIIQEDFLKFDLNKNFTDPVTIIGNFPYNISSQIFFKVLENKHHVSQVVCMVQKEVAERIRSGPGSKIYGILSILIQAYFHVDLLFSVSGKVFIPPPKVMSSVIRLSRNDTHSLNCNEELFVKLVKSSFNQRRKTLRNSLKTILLNLELDHPWMSKRPEQLSVDEFVELTCMVEEKLGNS